MYIDSSLSTAPCKLGGKKKKKRRARRERRGFKRDKNKNIGKNEEYLIDVNERIVLTEKNNLFFWGYNGFGQCSRNQSCLIKEKN